MISGKSGDKLTQYFRREWAVLLVVTITGIIYNVGLVAGPWFEGELAQTLYDTLENRPVRYPIALLAAAYVLVTVIIQAARYAKRYYVRVFANDVGRSMKRSIYRNLLNSPKAGLESEGAGSLMTKAISDAEACAEGMRKFTTEIFDTGIALAAYVAMLCVYDWRLTVLCCAFSPLSYLAANFFKKTVTSRASESREAAGRLNAATLDRVSGAVSYRITGAEEQRNSAYSERLDDYERAAVRSGLTDSALPPFYRIITMTGAIIIVFLGMRNVCGRGTAAWDIAAFTAYMSCFTRLAVKASKAAKLFNAVQKARVSWKRILPFLGDPGRCTPETAESDGSICVRDMSFTYPNGRRVLENISFTAEAGEFIGVTGPVGCGKSTLGRVFLCESPYGGSITVGGQELSALSPERRCGFISYLGSDPELLSDTIEENILLGTEADVPSLLSLVCFDGDLKSMPDGPQTLIGSGGVRLSGGQKARIALARTLSRHRPVIILDDPFSALDASCEASVLSNLRRELAGCTVIIISHRLTHFPEFDRVLWMEKGHLTESTHAELIKTCSEYRDLYTAQTGGAADE